MKANKGWGNWIGSNLETAEFDDLVNGCLGHVLKTKSCREKNLFFPGIYLLNQAASEKMLEGFNSREVKCKCKRKTMPEFWNDATSLNQNYFPKNTLLWLPIFLFLGCIRECFQKSKYGERHRNDYWLTQEIFSNKCMHGRLTKPVLPLRSCSQSSIDCMVTVSNLLSSPEIQGWRKGGN